MWAACRAAPRKVRQEGGIVRLTGALLALLLAGCAAKKQASEAAKPEEKKQEPEEVRTIYTDSGSLLIREPNGGPIRYEIRWKESQVDYTQEKGAKSGILKDVSGVLYQDNKPASTFTADTGYANQASKLLRLEGRVTVKGKEPAGTLTCEKMSWKTDEKLLKAYGGVIIRIEQGRMGPMDELWCLPDLKTAGTPGFGNP